MCRVTSVSLTMFSKGFIRIFGMLILCCLLQADAMGQGHRVRGAVTGYQGEVAFLAMMYGGNQYVLDTTSAIQGRFVFESDHPYQPGMYLVILPPSTSFFILLDESNPEFSFSAKIEDVPGTLIFAESPDNTAYYEYFRFFQEKKETLDKIKLEFDARSDESARPELLARMQRIKDEIVEYQKAIVSAHPGSLTAAMVSCELPVEQPNFSGSPEEIQFRKYRFLKDHYFDHIDLTDERLIRAPKSVLVDKVEYYMDYLTTQHPDSLIAGVDYILGQCEPAPVVYRFFVTHLFNKYRQSRNIGMDAVYVHIAEEYIAKGKTPWIEEDERNAVLAAVKRISPTLIGKEAPDFTVQDREGSDISLHGINARYTVLFFWAPDCAHCQKDMPVLDAFAQKYRSQDVEVFAVCTKLSEKESRCWDYLETQNFENWIVGSDQSGGLSSLHLQYNISTTPKIYVLDKSKTIIAKDFGTENLEEVMTRVLEQ